VTSRCHGAKISVLNNRARPTDNLCVAEVKCVIIAWNGSKKLRIRFSYIVINAVGHRNLKLRNEGDRND